MMRDPIARAGVLALACLTLLLPWAASAQQASGIAGVVRDTSGGVLPGVTVEAASPALIEKVRAVVTDGEGRYNIVDLRPGTYIVTFSLTGFNTFRREGIVLTSGFTATVNADMQVGALEETITVTGETPLVDTRNVRRQNVVARELLETLPTSTKNVNTFVTLVPGLGMDSAGRSLDVSGGYSTQVGGTYNGRGGTKTQFDGMGVQNLSGTGNTGYILNAQLVEEMVLQTSGISAESSADGAMVNMIPKEGANAFSGSISGLYSGESLQSSNLDAALRARGLEHENRILKIFDVGVTVGGPIRRDKVWFFTSHREWGNAHQNAGIFWNATQGTPFWTPDRNRPGDRYQWYESHALRVTWQASQTNKFNFFADIADVCVCRSGGGQAEPPETVTAYHFRKSGSGFAPPHGIYQVAWSSPVTSRLLFEAAAGLAVLDWPQHLQPGVEWHYLSIQDQALGFTYNARPTYLDPHQQRRPTTRFSVSYVTGSHNVKTGFNMEQGILNANTRGTGGDVSYRFNDAVPNQITQRTTPYLEKSRMKADLGMYVQDQWAIDRLTLNLGLRYDYFNAYVPEQRIPATPSGWIPERNFAQVKGVPEWHDLSPRLGAAYDLFGNGRTALKASLGWYVAKTGVNIANANNPINTSVNQVNRSWNDANRNYVPDCDLRNFAANGECGAISDQNFGQNNPAATRWADEVLRGWGVRDVHWDFVAEVQHQLTPDIGVSAGYNRSRYGNFRVTDNRAVTPVDHSPYCITAPSDPRLPGGGGYQVCDLYDINPNKFGQVENLVTSASTFGNQTRVNDFVNVTFNTRFATGLRLGGGMSTGRTVEERCFVVDSPQELLHCRVVTPFKAQTELKLNGSYPLPGDVVVSGVLLSLSGPAYTATYAATTAQIAPSLGRNLAGGTRTAAVPLIAPQTQFEGRIGRLDLRASKTLQLTTRLRLQANFDVYNVLNANSIITLVNTFGSRWLLPQFILDGRILQFSGRLTF